jgi:hypothetical protein
MPLKAATPGGDSLSVVRLRLLLIAVVIGVCGVVAGVAAPGGSARPGALGDGCLVMSQGFGKVTITLTRGVVFGRFQEGWVAYSDVDGDATANLPKVPGVPFTKVADHLWKFGPAANVRFRSSGPTKLIVNAQSVDLSVAGKGTAVLSVNGFIQDFAGKFSVDAASFCEDNFQQMPLTPTRFLISSPVTG